MAESLEHAVPHTHVVRVGSSPEFNSPQLHASFCLYRTVGNFAFFAGQEPFAKIKIMKFLLAMCKASEPRFNLGTSNYLFVLTATETYQ